MLALAYVFSGAPTPRHSPGLNARRCPRRGNVAPAHHARFLTPAAWLSSSTFLGAAPHRPRSSAPAARQQLRMGVQVETLKTGGATVSLRITVDGEATRSTYRSVLKNLAGKANVPGFRKGKVPTNILINFFGKEKVMASVAEELVSENVKKAVQEAGLQYLGQTDLLEPAEDVVARLAPGEPLSFEVKVEVWPEVTLTGPYKNVEIEANGVDIEDEEMLIDRALGEMRKRRSKLVDSDKTAAEFGLTAIASLKCFRKLPDGGKGEQIEGVAAGDNLEVPIEAGRFTEGFVEGMVGMQVGEVRDVPIVFPETQRLKDLAGTPAIFEVELHALKQRILPELTDAWAQEVGECPTVADLRNKLRESISGEAQNTLERNIEAAIESMLTSIIQVDLPESLVEDQVKQKFAELMTQLKGQGIPDDQIKAMITKENYEKYRTGPAREAAEKELRISFGIAKIAELEKITIDEATVNEQLANARREMGADNLDEKRTRDRIEAALERQKVFSFIRENCTMKLVRPEGAEKARETVAA